MRWSVKGLGLVSTVVLARILSPSDYGVVAMAMLVVGLADVLTDFGAGTTLLREPNATRDFIDSTWTLGIIQGLIVGSLLALAAPLAGVYFREPRVVMVIWIIAPCVVISSFGNIGITLARKELNFSLEFRYNVIAKVIGAGVTIASALLLRDYRALVIGVAAGYLSGLPLSYLMHPYRPRWCMACFGAMWHFSKWLLVSGIGQFATRKVDEIAAGRLGSTGAFGAYTVGSDIGQLMTAEIGPPINRALLPTLASMQDSVERMRSSTLKTLSVVLTVVLPLGAGLALVAPSATLVLLGPKWTAATPFIAIFALVGSVRVLSGPVAMLLLVMGHSKQQARIVWAEFGLFGLAALALVPSLGFVGLAYARLVSAVLIITIYLAIGRKYAGLHVRQVTRVIWRPCIGVGLMAALLPLFFYIGHAPITQLAVQVVAGAAIYLVWLFGSWLMVGRPDGLERMVLERLAMKSRPDIV